MSTEALEALENFENEHKGISQNSENQETAVTEITENNGREYLGDHKLPEVIDGYRVLKREDLPFNGKFYPSSWNFAYRCPTSKEVANFSTINEQDMPAIQTAVEELVKKCFLIVDSESNNEVSKEEINDGDRLFFFLKLREFYLHDLPINYGVINQAYNEPIIVSLFAQSLVFPTISEKLLSYYDGRTFEIPVPNSDLKIKFLMPTFKTSGRVFKYMVKTYQDLQKDETDSKKTVDNFDKQFLLFAPFLYEHGTETIETLKLKFKNIEKNDALFKGYLTLIQKIKLSNLEKIVYKYRESEEEALIKFPGGWKNMFINHGAFEDLFD